jgi:D-arabinose 1-dehydrogenase-like Zn-dependent alcohol dehydrogenase
MDRRHSVAGAFCGTYEHCMTGKPSRCQNTAFVRRADGVAQRLSLDGREINPFAEQTLVHERALVKVDPEVPFASAALLGCGAMAGLGAVFNTARPEVGSTAVVLGCRGVGLNVVQALASAAWPDRRTLPVARGLRARDAVRSHARPRSGRGRPGGRSRPTSASTTSGRPWQPWVRAACRRTPRDRRCAR